MGLCVPTRLVLALLLILLVADRATAAESAPIETVPIEIAQAEVALTGGWRFAPGDDARRAAPDFDDTAWERVDLTPEPHAHDADVGLTDYVPGWFTRGHAGYTGYAWYRLRIDVAATPGTRLALLAPAYVEDAFELYWNGRLLGGSGDFATTPPAIFGARPQRFELPHDAANAASVLAIRVWMRDGAEREPDAGGIHIAPRIGERSAIDLRYESQWRQTILGYIVDAVQPAAFVVLALIALAAARPSGDAAFLRRLAFALLLTAALRANQAVYFWTSIESAATFDIVKYVALEPLGLAAWMLAWHARFAAGRQPGIVAAIIALALATMLAAALDGVPDAVRTILRAAAAALLAAIVVRASPRCVPNYALSVVAVALVATGQFAEELWALGVPGIWFPFGVGVSRTQFAYAALIVVLGVLVLRTLTRRAAASTGVSP